MLPLPLLLICLPLAASIDLPLSEFNMQHRPLNLYVTANAVHVKTANRSITLDGTTVPYVEAFPPFRSRSRGTVLILTPQPDLLFFGRPSLFQMATATGHRTILPYVIPSNIASFINQLEMDHIVLVSFPFTHSPLPSQLEGAILIDPAVDSDLPPPSMPTVLLYTGSRTADQGTGEDWRNTRVESIRYITDSLEEIIAAREKFGQILANFLDRIHPR